MSRWFLRLLWLIGMVIVAALAVIWVLKDYQRSEYMKWNISHVESGSH